MGTQSLLTSTSMIFLSIPALPQSPSPLPCSLRECPASTTGFPCWSKIGFPTHVSQRPTTHAFSPSPTMELSTTDARMPTARPPSSQTAPRTPLTFPPAQQSQEPPASSPSATWASLTSSPRPGAPPEPMRMEPIFSELSLSALPHALAPQLQPQQPPPLPQPRQLLLPPPPPCPPQPQPRPPQQPPPPPRPPQLQQT